MKLEIYKEYLQKVSVENNKINTIEEVSVLKFLTELEHLDLTENPVTKLDSYRDKVFEALPKLFSLDGKDKDGNSVKLDESDYGEEGEFDMQDIEDIEERVAKLDPEQRKKYHDGHMDIEEMRALGLLPDYFGDEGGEEEFEENGDGELGKRERDGEDDEKDGGKKEQKTDAWRETFHLWMIISQYLLAIKRIFMM